ncbi:preprotein translocase subunit SecD family protein [Halorussus salinus]|uniref:hypothetical protein n=1 Tax=Halorussus salinus TaxID=1364935 RepID=UPI001092CF98|nr:hypothetical protein [Halorussus salinus]
MPSRRQVLAAGCLALVGSSGCAQIRRAVSAGDAGGEATTDDESTADSETTDTGTETKTSAASPEEFRIAVADGESEENGKSEEGDDETELVTGADVASVGEVEQARGGGYQLAVELTDEGTAAFADGLESVGAFETPTAHVIRTYFEGEMLTEATLGPGLASEIESGEWSGEFLFRVSERAAVEEVRAALDGN